MNELLDFAKTYMLTKLNTSQWDSLTNCEKDKMLQEALRQVKSIDGIKLPDELTDAIKEAICEVCLDLINFADNETFSKLQRAGVTSISYGNDSVSFGKTNAQTNNSYINNYAYSLLRSYIQRSFKIV